MAPYNDTLRIWANINWGMGSLTGGTKLLTEPVNIDFAEDNCLCTLWLYSQPYVALFVWIPNLCQADIWMFKYLSNDKEEIAMLIPRL